MLKLVVSSILVAYTFAFPFQTGERIINGTDAEPGEFPYIASLRYDGYHTCGCSILDEWHVLTAAHCVEDASADIFAVQYGVTNISSEENVINVTKLVIHEDYDPTESRGFPNDVAVLTLASPILFSEDAQPTTLPFQDEPPLAEAPAVLAGWGVNYTGASSVMENLQEVDLLVYSDEDCQKAHGSKYSPKYHVCAGVPEGGKGQCSGDSGGPLYSFEEQIGIVSWSVHPCALKGYPGVFVRVSSYVDWIQDKLQSSVTTTRYL